ncbi:conserved hypothetical protein [Frankia canadensis]|uniref:Uncharacterized protein n=1 Tax=Frankia canadensis TaxID=1836972 RepID=A0A2I2L2E9_9ACTN|nr:conserved hypothetical protein [Frankia canadensis]SOU59382.1 conserved hypothetical protein [Frankia canadensis]
MRRGLTSGEFHDTPPRLESPIAIRCPPTLKEDSMRAATPTSELGCPSDRPLVARAATTLSKATTETAASSTSSTAARTVSDTKTRKQNSTALPYPRYPRLRHRRTPPERALHPPQDPAPGATQRVREQALRCPSPRLHNELGLTHYNISIHHTCPQADRERAARHTQQPGPHRQLSIMALTCTVTLPPNLRKIADFTPTQTTPDLRLKVGVADHPWRDRNSRRPGRRARAPVAVADHPWRDRNLCDPAFLATLPRR